MSCSELVPVWMLDNCRSERTQREEGDEWMCSRPPCIQALVRQFPPSCVVKMVQPLCCGVGLGQYGLVCAYHEDGRIGVKLEENATEYHKGHPQCLECICAWADLTREYVEDLFCDLR